MVGSSAAVTRADIRHGERPYLHLLHHVALAAELGVIKNLYVDLTVGCLFQFHFEVIADCRRWTDAAHFAGLQFSAQFHLFSPQGLRAQREQQERQGQPMWRERPERPERPAQRA